MWRLDYALTYKLELPEEIYLVKIPGDNSVGTTIVLDMACWVTKEK